MEQTFVQQCNEDSRLAMKLLYIVRNIRFLADDEPKTEREGHCEEDAAPNTDTPKEKPAPKPKKDLTVAACSHCGDEFEHRSTTKAPKYCSRSCKDKAHRARNKVERKCDFCGKVFLICKYGVTHARHPDRICCSRACANKARPDRAKFIQLECAWCGKTINRRECRLRAKDSYCSTSCAAKKFNADKTKEKKAKEVLGWLEGHLRGDFQ